MILGGIMLFSGVAGYACMDWWHDQKIEERKKIYVDAYNNGQERGGDGDNSLVSLARKMTRRIVGSPYLDSSTENANATNLQKQVTRFW
jgi:hypothetical protein